MDKIDDLFRKFEKEGKTDIDNLIKWMKDSKLIEASKEGEQKARMMFKDAQDIKRIQLDKFKKVINKLAEEQKKTVDQLSQQLADEGQKTLKAAMAGLTAFKEALKGK